MYPGRMRKSLRGSEGRRVSDRSGPAPQVPIPPPSPPHSLVGEPIAAAEELLRRQPVVGHVAGAAADQIVRHGPAACPPRHTERTRAPTAAGRSPLCPPRDGVDRAGPARAGADSAPWRLGGPQSRAQPRPSPGAVSGGSGDTPGTAIALSLRQYLLSSFSAWSPYVFSSVTSGHRGCSCAPAEQPGPCTGRRQPTGES